jgi:hypothetical protein
MGLVSPQREHETQVVIFTIKGTVDEAQRDHWNQAVAELKKKFPKLVGVTIGGTSAPSGA